jgi:hypothetical protein
MKIETLLPGRPGRTMRPTPHATARSRATARYRPPARARASARVGAAVSERGTEERRAESSGERIHAAGGSPVQAEHTTVLSTPNRI